MSWYVCAAAAAAACCLRTCHGTRLEWCSITERTTSSPFCNREPQLAATRLIASVAPRAGDLARVGRADEARDGRARRLVRLGRARREGVRAAVDVRIVAREVARHRVDHGGGFLRRRRRIEVDERLVLPDGLVEQRKVGPAFY